MIKHFLTTYTDQNTRYFESWLQLNLLGYQYDFSIKRYALKKDHPIYSEGRNR